MCQDFYSLFGSCLFLRGQGQGIAGTPGLSSPPPLIFVLKTNKQTKPFMEFNFVVVVVLLALSFI